MRKGDVPVAVRAYFDSSRSDDQSGAGVRVTLASYMATPDCWSELQQRWARVLAGDGKRPACRYLHMKELQALQGEFAITKGWNEEARLSLLRDLNNDCLSPLSRVDYEGQFFGAVCTIELEDYRKAQATIPELRAREPERVCLDYVLHLAIAMIPNDPSGPFGKSGFAELYFDRGEPFFKHVDRLCRKPQHRRPPLLRHVSKLAQTEMATTPPLQAADFLAWATNRAFTAQDEFYNLARCLIVPAAGIRLDYKKLIEEYGLKTSGSN